MVTQGTLLEGHETLESKEKEEKITEVLSWTQIICSSCLGLAADR